MAFIALFVICLALAQALDPLPVKVTGGKTGSLVVYENGTIADSFNSTSYVN